jgi:hypothetical protein
MFPADYLFLAFDTEWGAQMEIDKWGWLDKLRLSLDTWGAALPPYAGLDEAIESMERRYEKHPSSWVVAYTLGDLYQRAGRYADSMAVGADCVVLRPKDVRSRYSLATAHRMPGLTKAQIIEQCKQVPEPGSSLMISRHDARHWFLAAVKVAGPRSRKLIESHIRALMVQYEHFFGRPMNPDFERYLDVRNRPTSLDRLERYVTGRTEEYR